MKKNSRSKPAKRKPAGEECHQMWDLQSCITDIYQNLTRIEELHNALVNRVKQLEDQRQILEDDDDDEDQPVRCWSWAICARPMPVKGKSRGHPRNHTTLYLRGFIEGDFAEPVWTKDINKAKRNEEQVWDAASVLRSWGKQIEHGEVEDGYGLPDDYSGYDDPELVKIGHDGNGNWEELN